MCTSFEIVTITDPKTQGESRALKVMYNILIG